MKVIGLCIGENSTDNVIFISKTIPDIGEYVLLEYDDMKILGITECIIRGSPSITNDIIDPDIVKRILKFEGIDEQYVRGKIKLLGDIDKLKIPRRAPPPGTEIKKVNSEILKKIFSNGDIRLGTLLSNPDVEVKVDLTKMITRHLSILAITGAGKSNTVSIIVDNIVKLGGMPLIFDMHSEYVDAEFTNGVNLIKPKLNPIYLLPNEFKVLINIGKDAYIQERFLRKAYRMAMTEISKGNKNFIKEVTRNLEEFIKEENKIIQTEKNAVVGVINKVEDFESKYKGLVDAYAGEMYDQLELGRVNVIDLGSVDEDYADVIVSHMLRKLLYLRKHKKVPPIFFILEEAHLLAPANRPTMSKYWIERIAREGRKFGLGLCLVSQRPKSLDSDSLSQANNSIIMRLVEPSDQRHVQQTSERLSDDLIEQLNSLNVGEAIVLGLMVKVPALVKIDKFEGKISGVDPNIIQEWKDFDKNKKIEIEKEKKEVESLYNGMDI